jgi:hypothetical protein
MPINRTNGVYSTQVSTAANQKEGLPMAVEEAIRFFENFDLDAAGEDFTVGSLLERAKAEGYQITEDDLGAAAQQIVARLREPGELDDDELEAVAGGLSIGGPGGLTSHKVKKRHDVAMKLVKYMGR